MRRLKELWDYRELIRNLVIRDLKVRYRNSVLGIAWSWANPLLMMLVYTMVFKFLADHSNLPHFHIFVLCALLPWNFFSASVGGATTSIVSNGHLIKKVYFPREILPISIVLSNLVNFVIALPGVRLRRAHHRVGATAAHPHPGTGSLQYGHVPDPRHARRLLS
jgi:lipopolysaccharide transport system permease protein